jgi:phosphatidate cytidylyltransferase
MASQLSQRLISGTIAAIIALTLTILSAKSFCLLLIVIILIGAKEWLHISAQIFTTHRSRKIWMNLGFLPYILPATVSLLWIRTITSPVNATLGLELILGFFALIWTTDISAYAFGKWIGGAKLAPRISPNKTWAGLIGAMISTGLVFLLIGEIYHLPSSAYLVLLGAVFAITSQLGDMGESWLKRKANLKDSGSLLPGHGGILDRIDGIITAAPLYAIWVYFTFFPLTMIA